MTAEDDPRAGLARLDGYLYWQGRLAESRRHAEATADRLPWLTTAQRDELVRVLTTAHTETARRTVRHISERAARLRTEYEERYRVLRRRLVAAVLVTALVLAVGLAVALTPFIGAAAAAR